MKTLKDYITESRTRVLITLNKDADMNKEYSIVADSADEKYMKGNKNNVCEIKFKLTKRTKTNYETVTGIEVTGICFCDENKNDNPHWMDEKELKDFNTITIEDNTSCYIIRVGDGNNNGIDTNKHYVAMAVNKLYKNTLGDAFDVKA